MNREKTFPPTQQAEELIAQLVKTVVHIDADDLSGLAQMHGWCEALIELGKQDQAVVGEDQVGCLIRLTCKLEELILGEAADASVSLSTVVQQIQLLAGQASGEPYTDATESECNATVELTDEELNAKLAAVFGDEPTATQNDELLPPSGVFPMDEAPAEPAIQELPAQPAMKVAEDAPKADAPKAYVSEPLIIDPKELDFLKSFVQEAQEHIESIEQAVLEVERAPNDAVRIDDLFRPFHTIKGMAGFLNLRDVASLTHEAETLLDQARKGKRAITPGVIDLTLGVVDILKTQIASIGTWVDNPNSSPVAQPPVTQMIERLRAVVSNRVDPGACSRRNEDAVTVAPSVAVGEQAVGTSPEASTAANNTKRNESIRIDTDKLDALIDIVGELVIAQTLVNMSGDIAASPKLSKDVTQVTKIVRDVQEMTMAMRMIPIGPTFQKMARLVRDVSRKANKKVELSLSGEDTELDKTVIQEIGDPLVHMVRNAVDHGIESGEVRRSLGKPEIGQVHLHAGHEGGNIVITIRDDGKGLDPAVLIAKAVEKGLLQPGEEVTDQQAFALVFAPGFSTASQVTDISGRGVGMDVVKRNIDQLRGHIEISSVKGQGTTFTIRLPLTLAIIDGMVIRLGDERFIIPTIGIQQSLRPLPENITSVQHRGEVLNVRGQLIPLVQLGEMFGLTKRVNPCQAMVVIVHSEGRLIGLVIEELIGQQQVVIKSLGERFEGIKGVSGAAILGDGRVGLILEMTGIGVAHDMFKGGSRMDTTISLPEENVSRQTTTVSEQPDQGPTEPSDFQPALK